jgi:hypothetical protein
MDRAALVVRSLVVRSLVNRFACEGFSSDSRYAHVEDKVARMKVVARIAEHQPADVPTFSHRTSGAASSHRSYGWILGTR